MDKRTRWPHHLTESLNATSRSAAAPSAPRQVVGWLLGGGLIGLVVFGPGAYQLVRLSIRQRQLDARMRALHAEQQRLTDLEQRLRTDPTYMEGLIRTTFKVSQPGEYVIPIDPASRMPLEKQEDRSRRR